MKSIVKKITVAALFAALPAVAPLSAEAQSRLGSMRPRTTETAPVHGSWSFSYEMTSAKEGVAILTLKIDPDWHVYGEKIGGVGPVALDFNLTGTGGLELVGAPASTPAPSAKVDDTFGFEVTYYKDTVTFRQPFRLVNPTLPAVKGTITWQTCSGNTCTRPNTTNVNIVISKK